VSIEVRRVTKCWDTVVGVADVSLQINSGELVALLGPSGSGKTTLLRIIAGLEEPDVGTVLLSGADAGGAGVRERGVGFVFQHYALFRHMTVFENVAFGLRVQQRRTRASKQEISEKVERLLGLVQLEGLSRRLPSQLSGGQRQRVALARALAVEPKVLLLDEPFGALDAKVREELRRWLRRLHDELHVTSVFVTHDQEEALEVADRVVVMNHGRVEQVGTPTEVMDHPVNEFVNEFVGQVNVLPGIVRDEQAEAGAIRAPAPGMPEGQPVRLLVRTYDAILRRDEPGAGTVERIWAIGDRVKVSVAVDGVGPFIAQIPRWASQLRSIEPGCRVAIEVAKARVYASV
jgi:sulfate transport system ATP-binding protein